MVADPPPVRKVLTIGACTAFEIAASNLSLLTLSVSFHTMVKSSTPLFVLLCSITLGLERPNRTLFAAMGLVTVGVMLCSYGEVKFELVGFLYVLTAAMAGGLRWSLSQMLLQNVGNTASNESHGMPGGGVTDVGEALHCNLVRAVELLYHQLPVSVAALVPVWFGLERLRLLAWIAIQGESVALLAVKLCLVVAGCAILAFVLIVTELSLLALTSSVTLAISGIAKELLLIAAAVVIFGDTLSSLNVVGFFIAIVGVGLYKYHKLQAMGLCGADPVLATQREALGREQEPLLAASDVQPGQRRDLNFPLEEVTGVATT